MTELDLEPQRQLRDLNIIRVPVEFTDPDTGGMMRDVEFRSQRQPAAGSGEKGLQVIQPKRIGIEKSGDQFQLWVSWQGEPMHPEGAPVTFKANGPVYVGIGFTSHLPDRALTAQVKSVTLENRAGAVR